MDVSEQKRVYHAASLLSRGLRPSQEGSATVLEVSQRAKEKTFTGDSFSPPTLRSRCIFCLLPEYVVEALPLIPAPMLTPNVRSGLCELKLFIPSIPASEGRATLITELMGEGMGLAMSMKYACWPQVKLTYVSFPNSVYEICAA